MQKSIKQLAVEANQNGTAKGFWNVIREVCPKMEALKHIFTQEEIEEVKEAEYAKKLALISSEVSEALEARRKGKFADRESFQKGIPFYETIQNTEVGRLRFENSFTSCIKDSFEDEMADAFIRIIELCEELNIDLMWFVEHKMKYNSTRPPKHGKAY